MIPARPAAPPPPPLEGVSSRLNRLRLAQRERLDRPAAPSPVDSTPRWLSAALAPTEPRVVQQRPYGRRGTAGPPPPPSWTARGGVEQAMAVDGRNQQGTWTQPIELVERRKLAAPLQGAAENEDGPASLLSSAGCVAAADLALGAEASLLLEHVAYLPNHLRLRLLDVIADWRNAAPLTSEGMVELLRLDISDGYEVAPSDGAEAITADDDDWERAGLGGDNTSPESLTELNLSFSAVSLRALRSVLLYPAGSAPSSASSRAGTPSTAAPPLPPVSKLLPTFPLLTTLNLTGTSRIHFNDGFFELLAYLISLRHLSLCGKTLDSPFSTVTSSTFLPRLAAATPTLHVLDLSYIDFAHAAVKSLDWDVRWLQLRMLGMRRELVDWKGEEVGWEKKERIRKEIWQFISQGRQKKRRWLEVVV